VENFEELLDDEAKWIGYSAGLYSWKDRADLNSQWNNLMMELKKLNERKLNNRWRACYNLLYYIFYNL
jgi:hypothetical protein